MSWEGVDVAFMFLLSVKSSDLSVQREILCGMFPLFKKKKVVPTMHYAKGGSQGDYKLLRNYIKSQELRVR